MAILAKAIYMFNAISIRITMTIIKTWEIYPKTHFETQETANSQGNSHQREQCWKYHNTQFQTILQTNSNKNSMVLAQT
jgi:hypothetical protein